MTLLKRKFILGDEWLYIKLYAGYNFLDKILIDEIYDAVIHFYKKRMILQFFFVRYNDDIGSHLRLRFQIKPKQLNKIIGFLNSKFSIYVDNRLIQNYLTDTYTREIERYGLENIESIEKIFSYNSLLILHELRLVTEGSFIDKRWISSCKIIDNLLNSFGLGPLDKHQIFEEYYKAYEREFDVDKQIKDQLSKKYRIIYKEIIEIILTNKKLKSFSKIEKENNLAVKQISIFHNNQKQELFSLLKNVIHMHFNRVFVCKPRENELIMYFTLSKIYKTIYSIIKFKQKKAE